MYQVLKNYFIFLFFIYPPTSEILTQEQRNC